MKKFSRVLSMILAMAITFTSVDVTAFAAVVVDENGNVIETSQTTGDTAGDTTADSTDNSSTADVTGDTDDNAASDETGATGGASSQEGTSEEGTSQEGTTEEGDIPEESTEEEEELDEDLLLLELLEDEENLKESGDGWEISEDGVLTFDSSVTTINARAFVSNQNITSVVFPANLTEIGGNAFYNCKNLTSVTIPSKVTYIGMEAFSLTGVKTVTIEAKNLSCGENIFEGCTLESVSLPEGMVTLPKLFERASFVSGYVVDIPASVQTISTYAFLRADGLASVNFKGNRVLQIEDLAFANIPSLQSIDLPENLTTIGYEAFYKCSGLSSITIPSKVNFIDDGAFESSGIKTVVVNSKSLSCDYGIFEGCTLESVSLPDGMVTLPKLFNRATFVPGYVLNIPTSVQTISGYAFSNTRGLASLNFAGGNLQIIDEKAFYNAELSDGIVLPEKLTGIGYDAFNGCSGLASIIIPSKVNYIDDYAFANTGITNVIIKAKSISCDTGIFEGCTLESVSLPDGMVTLPKLFNSATFVPGYVVSIPKSVQVIEERAFANANGLALVNFEGTNLQVIGDKAFYCVESLEKIDLPEKLTAIGYQAFCGCKGLTSITIPEKVNTIYEEAFASSGISNVVVKSKRLVCGINIFSGCVLESVNLQEGIETFSRLFESAGFVPGYVLDVPASVKNISDYAFAFTTGLESVDFLGNKIQTIDDDAFYCAKSLESITLPNSVTEISFEAFYGCSSLERIYLGPNITYISSDTFWYSDLAYFYVPGKNSATYKTLVARGIDPDRIVVSQGIKYVLNGGVATGTYPSSFSKVQNTTITLQNPTRADYRFLGWYTDSKLTKPIGNYDETEAVIDVSSISTDLTLYAKWEGPIYTVTFDAGNYAELTSADEATRVVVKGSTYGTLPEVTLKGEYADTKKMLDGWYTADGELITATTKVTDEAKNQVLYKKFLSVKPEVKTPVIGLWNSDNGLYGQVGDKVFIRCATDAAELTYDLLYSTDGESFAPEEADVEYTGTFRLNTAGVYKVVAKAKLDNQMATAEEIITIEDTVEAPALYDESKANAFWVTYTVAGEEKIYDSSEISVPYTGAKVALKGYKLYFGKTELTENVDYKVSYKNNTKVANYDAGLKYAPTIVFTAKGNYSGTIEKLFSIYKNVDAQQIAAKNITITLDKNEFEFCEKDIKPTVTSVVYKKSKNDPEITIPAEDYTVTYSNNFNASNKAQVIVTFTGENYCGTATKTFRITKLDIAKATVDGRIDIIPDDTKAGLQYKTSNKNVNLLGDVVLKDGDTVVKTLVKNKDFTTSVKRKTVDGKRCDAVTILGKGNYTLGAIYQFYLDKQPIDYYGTVIPAASSQIKKLTTYTPNTVVEPVYVNKKDNYAPAAYTVVDAFGDVLKANSDYTVSYRVDEAGGTDFVNVTKGKNYPVGTAVEMTISAKTNSIYEGQIVLTYHILEGYDITSSSDIDVTVADVVYANKPNNFNAKVVVKDLRTNKTLTAKKDYTVEYVYADETLVAGKNNKKSFTNVRQENETVKKTDIVPAGTTLKAVIKGIGNYNTDNTIVKTFRVGYNINTVTAKVNTITYGENAVPVKPAESDITVTLKNVKVNPSNFDITNYVNNTKAGTASFILEGKGNYVGTKKVTYKISAKSAKYTVSYDKGLGSIAPKKKAMTNTQTAVNTVLSANAYVAPAGYEFAGWAYAPQSKLPETVSEMADMRADLNLPAAKTNEKVAFTVDTYAYPIGTAVTLYAWFKPATYTLKYNLNGGKNVSTNTTTYNNVEGAVLTAPTKNKYTFDGWYYDSKFTNPVPKNETEDIWVVSGKTGTLNVYAKWVKQ